VAGPLTAKLRCTVASGCVEPVECQSLQIADVDDLAVAVYAEVAEIGWNDTMNTLPDHQGRHEDYSLTNR